MPLGWGSQRFWSCIVLYWTSGGMYVDVLSVVAGGLASYR